MYLSFWYKGLKETMNAYQKGSLDYKNKAFFNQLHARHELEYMAEGLHNEVLLYQDIVNGNIIVTDELKKAVQTSIKELCTALIACVEDK